METAIIICKLQLYGRNKKFLSRKRKVNGIFAFQLSQRKVEIWLFSIIRKRYSISQTLSVKFENICFSCNIFLLIRSIQVRQKGSDDLNDSEIIDLFYMRSERAIMELAAKYGNACNKVAKNILNNILDAEECVNDAYLGAWNTIPPQNPNPLLTYICRIVRNLSIKKYHTNTSVKRNRFYHAPLDEQ